MESQDQPGVPQDEMTEQERKAAGLDQPDDAQAAEAEQVQRGHEASGEGNGEGGDDSDPEERTDDPKPVDDPDLPEDGDPDQFESNPISPHDMDQSSDEAGEQREEPADLSGVKKEFDD